MKLTLKDIAMFYCCSLRTAQIRKEEIRLGLSLTKRHVSIYDLSCYEGLTVSEVKKAIGLRYNH